MKLLLMVFIIGFALAFDPPPSQDVPEPAVGLLLGAGGAVYYLYKKNRRSK